MSDPYPIVDEKALGRPGRGGPFGWGRPFREWGEVPRVSGKQVRVFLVDGNHIVDHGHRADDDEQIVRATHVTVVDMTRDREVETELTIPSADGSEFTVRVTFLCTVDDPVSIVREGQGDAPRALHGYVRSHHRLFQLGLDRGLPAINTVRLNVQTQIEAYVQLKPPAIPGLSVRLASVEVLTPDEVAQHGTRMLAEELRTEFERFKIAQEEEMRKAQQEFALERKSYELKLAQREQYLQEMEQSGRQRLESRANAHTLNEALTQHEAVGVDPLKRLLLARERGELTDTELADRLQAEVLRRQEHADRAEERQFLAEQEERTRRYQREDAHWEAERIRLEREYETEKLALERSYETQEAWKVREREDRLHLLGVRLDMLKEIAKHGHLNEISLDPEQLINGIAADTGAARTPLAGPPDAGELPEGSADGGGRPQDDADSGKEFPEEDGW